MAFVGVAASVGTAVGLGGTAAIIGGGALIGAGVGGLYSAVTGDGNILNSMLTGGLIGGAGAYGLGAFGLGGAEAQALMAGPFFGGPAGTVPMVTPGPAATAVSTPTPALQAAQGLTASSSPAAFEAAAAAQGVYPEGAAALRGAGMTVAPDVVTPQMIAQGAAPVAGSGPSGMKMLGYGLAGTTALSLLGGKQKGPGAGTMPDPGTVRPFEYTSTPTEATGEYPSPYATARYEASGNPIMDTRERNYFTQDFAALQPYSAKTGTINPNVPLPSSNPIAAAGGGVMRGYDDELGGDYSAMGMDQGNLQKGLFGMGYAAGGQVNMGGGLGAIGSSMNQSTISPMTLPFMGMPATGGPGAFPPIMNHLFNGTNTTTQQDIMGGDRRVNPLSFSEIMGGGLSSILSGKESKPSYPSLNQNPNTNTGGFAGPSSFYGGGGGGFGGGAGGSGGPFPLEGQYGIVKMAAGGDVDLDEERNKMIMRNIKGASTKELEKTLKALDQQEFLRKNMPAYAESMRPSISSMVEGAQYGDRMTQAYGGQPKDFNIIPTTVDPQRGMYGGIAQIGQNIDPQTRVNAMANIQRTPYDRNVMDSVRRVGVGVDRQIGRDANLSAFYEQDPMGRNRMGGARYTQRFEEGGSVKNYSFGGLALIENLMRQAEQGQMPRYQFDQANQTYSNVTPQQIQPSDFSRFFSALSSRETARPSYTFDSSNQTYQPMAAGGMTSLGGYSDGGRMLKGPGDGMSDSIPGVIGNKQPARLADGEFVVPADVVSHLGNGSTDAGAKRLYAMMDKVRKARTGNKKQGKQIKAEKYLPA